MVIQFGGKQFEVPNYVAALAVSVSALAMSVGMGGCNGQGAQGMWNSLAGAPPAYDMGPSSNWSRSNVQIGSVNANGNVTIGGDGRNIGLPGINGVNRSAGINNAANQAVNNGNNAINDAKGPYTATVRDGIQKDR